ncbi:Mor transcription activator family protein [Polaromonas sp.]|uniref:Mor transcription activator family protein n=1 Tax=Polaromonas sp. TaxID=1869339 RepID=UPI003568F762
MNTTKDDKPAAAKEHEAAFLLQAELAAGLQHEFGLKPEFSQVWAARLTGFLRIRLGAQEIYIPAPSKAERDAAIFREFDGTNAAAVMQRHGVSRSRLYQIFEEQRAMQLAVSPVSSLKTGQDSA